MDYKAICSQLLSTALDTAGGVCKTLGSSCSIVGGAGIVAYYAIKDEKLAFLYYGEESSQAGLYAQASVSELNYLNHRSFFIPHQEDKYGEKTIPFNKIVTLEDIKIYSIVLMWGGAVLNSLGHLIHTWNQGKNDRKTILEREARDIGMPGFAEYSNALTGSVFASVSQILMSAGVMGTYIGFGEFFTTTHTFTYPAESEQNISKFGQTLLLETKTYNLSKHYRYNDRIDLPLAKWPDVPNSINLQSILNATANISLVYGAGLFYKPDPNVMLFPLALIPGGLSGYARHFFANKAERLRATRLLDGDVKKNGEAIEMSAASC